LELAEITFTLGLREPSSRDYDFITNVDGASLGDMSPQTSAPSPLLDELWITGDATEIDTGFA